MLSRSDKIIKLSKNKGRKVILKKIKKLKNKKLWEKEI